MSESNAQSQHERAARRTGILVQGLVLGILLSFALFELWAQADAVRLFRYQSF